MAHHKMHDNQWTPLPTNPAQDPKRRELHRPSTAATLNLAATAAQGSRLFKDFDGDFAEKLLHIARTAYDAAKANPKIYASGADWDLGGGAYSDRDVTDEFYWAAAELFLTTGESRFASHATTSKWHSADIFNIGGFSWGSTAALGRLSLATVPSKLPDRDRVVASVLAGADKYLRFQETQAYDTLMSHYPWGSNSNQMNGIQVIASAYDVSGNTSYRRAALVGLDYALGRNALAQSYVTGYGEKHSQNQHSRLYAHQLDVQSPRPPAGSLAGGANQDPSDPPANDVLKGCAPQHCYVDDVNSYSTNEVAVNWNSGLAWVASWAADQGAMSSRLTFV
jgi:endoglucanase